MRNEFKAVLFLLLFFVSVNSFAQSENTEKRNTPPVFAKLLEKMDTNSDSKISNEEVKGRLKHRFVKIDAGQDGFITEDEFKTARKAIRSERNSSSEKVKRTPPTYQMLLEKMDANADSKLSREEVKGRLKQHFLKIDMDKDGFITEEEFKNKPKPKRREND